MASDQSPDARHEAVPDDSAATTRPTGRYQVNVPLRWSDMDAYGHVNNVQFLRLLEDARVIGFEEWFGQDRSVLSEGILVARHEIEYLAPLLFRVPPIVVQMWATKIGGAGFDLAYEVRDGRSSTEGGEGDVVYARAETTLVLYDFATGRPRLANDAPSTSGVFVISEKTPNGVASTISCVLSVLVTSASIRPSFGWRTQPRPPPGEPLPALNATIVFSGFSPAGVIPFRST